MSLCLDDIDLDEVTREMEMVWFVVLNRLSITFHDRARYVLAQNARDVVREMALNFDRLWKTGDMIK